MQKKLIRVMQLFQSRVQSLVEGKRLQTEDLLDVYTLQSQTTDPFRQDSWQEIEDDPILKATLYHWNFPPALYLLINSSVCKRYMNRRPWS